MAKVYTLEAYREAVGRREYVSFFTPTTIRRAEEVLKGSANYVVVADFFGLADQYLDMVYFVENNGIPCYFLNHHTAIVTEMQHAVLIGMRF